MKKILFLFILCIIKLNAYDYMYRHQIFSNGSDYKYTFLKRENRLIIEFVHNETTNIYNGGRYDDFQNIKNTGGRVTEDYIINTNVVGNHYISKICFDEILKSDIYFLNDLYTLNFRNQFLNYLYNDDSFNNSLYINYDNYELLYNSEGFAVASYYNGEWAGLYDNSTISQSGYLYNESNDLVLVNGQEPTFFEKLYVKLFGGFAEKFLNASFVFDISIIFIVCLVFTILFWIIYHAVDGFRYYLRIRKMQK